MAVAGRRRAFFRYNIRTSRAQVFQISRTQGRKRLSGRRALPQVRSFTRTQRRNRTPETRQRTYCCRRQFNEELAMQEAARDRASTGFVVVHPLDPEDATITAAMRAMTSSIKGARQGIEARGQFDAFMESVLPRDDVTFEADTLGGIPGIWVHPANSRSDEAIVHLHGGWFNFGSARAYRHLVGHLAARAGARAFIPDYRLAPEHPFPAATDDVLACYRGLAGSGVRRIALTGDSAGGNLALVLASRVTGEAVSTDATLVGVAVLSPVTDLTLSGATYDTRADADPFFTRPQVEALVHSYLGSADAKHPLASPLHRHLACHPSAFMSVTTKCCWTIRFDISVVQLPQASMPGSTCGWACRTGFPEASEDLRRQRKRWMPSVL